MTYEQARQQIEKAASGGAADHTTVRKAKDACLAHILKATHRL